MSSMIAYACTLTDVLSTERTIEPTILKIRIVYPLRAVIPEIALNHGIVWLLKLPRRSALAGAGV